MPQLRATAQLHRPCKALDGPDARRPAPKLPQLLRNSEHQVKFLHGLRHDRGLPAPRISEKRFGRN